MCVCTLTHIYTYSGSKGETNCSSSLNSFLYLLILRRLFYEISNLRTVKSGK